MNYAEIKYCDIANGVGVRTSLFVSGCRHRCPGCFNRGAWSFGVGEPFTREVEDALIASLEPPYVAGLTVLGGEPLEPENQQALLPFLRRLRHECPGKGLWVYSGFTWEELTEGPSRACTPDTPELLGLVDVLVDGRYVQELHDITLRFRGSSNQRLIDVPQTLSSGTLTLWQDERVFATHEW